MPLIFSTDFENGSLIEKVSGRNISQSNVSKFYKNKKGLAYGANLLNTYYDSNSYFNTQIDLSTKKYFTVVFYGVGCKGNGYASNGFSIGGETSYYQSLTALLERSGGAGTSLFYVGITNTQSFNDGISYANKYNFIAILYNGDGVTNADKFKIFRDGIWKTITFSGTLPQYPCLGNRIDLNSTFFHGTQTYGQTYKLAVWDSLEEDMIYQYYQELTNRKPIVKTKSKIIFPPILAQKTDGLIAEYNFANTKKNVVVNEAPSSSANGNNPSQFNGLAKQGITMGLNKLIVATNKPNTWNGNYIDCGTSSLNLINKLTICCTFEMDINKAKTQPDGWQGGLVTKWVGGGQMNSSFFLGYSYAFSYGYYGPLISVSTGEGGNQYYAFINNTTTFPRYLSGVHTIIGVADGNYINLYFDGIFVTRTACSINISNNTSTKLLINSNILSGQYFTSAFNYYNARIYNRAISTQEIQDYHNQYATQPILLEDFSDYAVNTFPTKNWKKGGTTGIYVSQLTSDVTKFPELVKGVKNMYIINAWCSFTTNVKIPRGSTIEWYWTGNNSVGSSQSVYFFDSIGNSYLIQILSDRTLRIVRAIGANFLSLYQSTSTFTNNIWYKMKFVLNINNTLSLYVDDVLITTTNANTEISSINRLQFNSAFQSVANIKITEGIIV